MISTTKAAVIMGLSARRVRALCEQGRVPGAIKVSARCWVVPKAPIIVAPAAGSRSTKKA